VIASTNLHDYSLDDAELDNKNTTPRPFRHTYGSGLLLDEISEDMSVDDPRFPSQDGAEENCEGGAPPAWEPVDAYNYPVGLIPPALEIPDNLQFDDFADLKHIADGSNSNVYTAKFHGQIVIVKMITESAKADTVAVHEFDVEHGMLARFDHPNIVKLIGAGRNPRRFIVLEHLAGGSLAQVLSGNEQTGLAKKFFKKSTFSWPTLLKMAKDVADAFAYLHGGVHDDCSVIHRDLKPDNVGFTADGSVKLFDFGLCTLVRRTQTAEETYEMTGNTGSLRYMAAEVALRKPYNEKVDVYSFGILLWQMAKDKVPFKGMNRADFMNQVVRKGVRPKIDKKWPKEFVDLLESCWHMDFRQRPSFEMASHGLTRQLLQESPNLNRRSTLQKNAQTRSTWF
jgi:serine/threonine protein kinase